VKLCTYVCILYVYTYAYNVIIRTFLL